MAGFQNGAPRSATNRIGQFGIAATAVRAGTSMGRRGAMSSLFAALDRGRLRHAGVQLDTGELLLFSFW